MTGLFSLGAEPVYPGKEFSFSSSYSREKQLMSSCVLQRLLANKTVLVQFFPGSFEFEMTQILFERRSCGLSFASRLMLPMVSRFFNTVLLYFAWNSFSSASSTPFLFLISSNRLKQLLQTRLWSSFTNGNYTVVWSIAFKALNSSGRDKALKLSFLRIIPQTRQNFEELGIDPFFTGVFGEKLGLSIRFGELFGVVQLMIFGQLHPNLGLARKSHNFPANQEEVTSFDIWRTRHVHAHARWKIKRLLAVVSLP